MSNDTPNDPRKTEAKADTAEVKWRGHTFTVPLNQDDWTVDLLESIEEGKSVGIVRGALGPKQWQISGLSRMKVRDLGELAAEIAAALGFGSTGE